MNANIEHVNVLIFFACLQGTSRMHTKRASHSCCLCKRTLIENGNAG
jgi:hypothetical protein